MILKAGNSNNDTYRHSLLEDIKVKYPATQGINIVLSISERYADPGRADYVEEVRMCVEEPSKRSEATMLHRQLLLQNQFRSS